MLNTKNRTIDAITTRILSGQTNDIILADRIFKEALLDGLKPFNDTLNIEYTTDGVPSTGKEIFKMYVLASAKIENFKIFNGSNDAINLYFTPETNLLYRTLHDIDHAVNYQAGKGSTSEASELYLNCLMAKRAYTYAIKSGYTQAQAILTFLSVYHDTVGQVYYYFENNDFCENQKDLTAKLMLNCKGMAYLNDGLVTSAKQYIIGLMNICKVDVKYL